MELTEFEPRSRANQSRISGVPLVPSHQLKSGSKLEMSPRYRPMIRGWVPPPVLRSTRNRRLGGSWLADPVVPPLLLLVDPVELEPTLIGWRWRGNHRGVDTPNPAFTPTGTESPVWPKEWVWLNPE